MNVKWLAAAAALVPGGAVSMDLSSPDVAPGATLPIAQVYSRCGGRNVAPALKWSGAPTGTKSFVITMYDPDAHGGWWHWIAYAIPPNTTGLPSGGVLPPGARTGTNDFGAREYDGACPPDGSGPHHYQITVWAVKESTVPVEGADEGRMIGAYLSHYALAHATLTAIYER